MTIRAHYPFPLATKIQMMAGIEFGDGYYGHPARDDKNAWITGDVFEAQVATSVSLDPATMDGQPLHYPVLDIDFPIQVVPSTTPGHHHLYLDREMSWRRYSTLLTALMYAGIVEEGYARASIERGYSSVRLPWIRKD